MYKGVHHEDLSHAKREIIETRESKETHDKQKKTHEKQKTHVINKDKRKNKCRMLVGIIWFRWHGIDDGWLPYYFVFILPWFIHVAYQRLMMGTEQNKTKQRISLRLALFANGLTHQSWISTATLPRQPTEQRLMGKARWATSWHGPHKTSSAPFIDWSVF